MRIICLENATCVLHTIITEQCGVCSSSIIRSPSRLRVWGYLFDHLFRQQCESKWKYRRYNTASANLLRRQTHSQKQFRKDWNRLVKATVISMVCHQHESVPKKRMNNFWLERPTQLLIHGQWWSCIDEESVTWRLGILAILWSFGLKRSLNKWLVDRSQWRVFHDEPTGWLLSYLGYISIM